MKVAVFSDVHGNLSGLEAVLADIEEQEVDLVAFAGDLCLFGPRPAECLRRLRDLDMARVYGNTDEWLHLPPPIDEALAEETRQRMERLHRLIAWTRAQLTTMELAWLTTLPLHRRLSPSVQPLDDMLMVHANPKDVNQIIFPAEEEQRKLYGRVRQTDAELDALMGDLVFGAMVYGHLHIPNIRRWRGRELVNISSVSLPGDGDRRAKYGLLTWRQDEGWTAEHRRVAYPVEEEIAAFEAARPPHWEESVAELRNAGMAAQKV